MAEHKFTLTFADNQKLTGIPAAAIIFGFFGMLFMCGFVVGFVVGALGA